MKCIYCGNQLAGSSSGTFDKVMPEDKPIERVFSHLPAYYQEEFRKMEESKGSYKGKWNWMACIFNWIWAFTKGLWLVAVICLISIILTKGILSIVWLFIFGFRGNNQYYTSLKTGKQPWI
ncbi:MAG: hypothetical protein WCH62_05910 [Candidatus Omnitrophota bacterium]